MPSPHVFPRHTKAELPVAVAGDGCFLIDRDGKRYLDGCGGAAVSCLGHSDKAVVEAIKAQLDTLPYAHTGFFTTEPAESLAGALAARAPEGIDRVYFVSGGSEAAEAAIKLARQYFLEKGEPKRANVIARWQSYHGNTLGALAAGGNQWRRQQFEPLLTDAMHHVDACHYWRWGAEGESEEAYGRRAADALEAKILELGPETVAAFMAEPVVGATMGAVPPVPGYFRRIREICDRYGVLLILDEVMCGMGRTGTLFACEQDGVVPDMILIAKGLGAGYQPIERRDLLANVNTVGAHLRAGLEERFGQHPNVGDIRGRGLFLGMEFVADRDTRAPFDPNLKLNAVLKKAAMANGLMVYPMGGTIDGHIGDHVLIAPPFILTAGEADQLVDRLAMALDQALKTVGA